MTDTLTLTAVDGPPIRDRKVTKWEELLEPVFKSKNPDQWFEVGTHAEQSKARAQTQQIKARLRKERPLIEVQCAVGPSKTTANRWGAFLVWRNELTPAQLKEKQAARKNGKKATAAAASA